MAFKDVFVVLQTDAYEGGQSQVEGVFASRKLAEEYISSWKQELEEAGMNDTYTFSIERSFLDFRDLSHSSSTEE